VAAKVAEVKNNEMIDLDDVGMCVELKVLE
jgi:hypothetical protein